MNDADDADDNDDKYIWLKCIAILDLGFIHFLKHDDAARCLYLNFIRGE